jgi:hypothetical protein
MGGSPEADPRAVAVGLHEAVQECHKPLEGDPRQQRRQDRKDRKECVRPRLREKSSEDPTLAVVDIVPCPTHPSEGPLDRPTDPLERNRAMLPARFATFLRFVRTSQILHNRFHPREWVLFDE